MNEIVISIDSNEKFPYKFKNILTEKIKIKISDTNWSNDYSIKGFHHCCGIERKTTSDFLSSLIKKEFWEKIKWCKEKYELYVIVVEAELRELIQDEKIIKKEKIKNLSNEIQQQLDMLDAVAAINNVVINRSRIHKNSVKGMIAKILSYGIPVLFVGDRSTGEIITQDILEKFWIKKKII